MRRFALPLMLCLLSSAALAQDPVRYPGLGDGDTTPGTPQMPQDIELTVAAGVGVAPKYLGSSDYHAIFTPAVKLEYKQKAFLVIDRQAMMVPYEGLGIKMLGDQNWSVGFNMTYDKGRSDNTSPIRGIGDIDWTALGGVFAAYHPGNFFVRGQVGYDLLNEFNSYKGELGTGVVLPIDPSWRAMLEVDTAFAGEGYAKKFYGINGTQSASSGLPAFSAGSGFYRMGLGGTLQYTLTQGAFVQGVARWDQLLGDAADSPVSDDNSQFMLGTNVGYRF